MDTDDVGQADPQSSVAPEEGESETKQQQENPVEGHEGRTRRRSSGGELLETLNLSSKEKDMLHLGAEDASKLVEASSAGQKADETSLQLQKALEEHTLAKVKMKKLTRELHQVRRENKALHALQASLQEKMEEAKQEEDTTLDTLTAVELQAKLESVAYDRDIATERIRQLELDQAGLDVIKEENRRYRELVCALQDQMSDTLSSHAEEAHNIKKEAFNSRIQLEKTFRKTLQELDRKHLEKAFKDIDQASKNALMEKARVRDELALQTNGIESLTKRYSEQTKRLRILKTDNDILKEHQAVQNTKIATLKKDLGALQEEKEALQAALEHANDKVLLADRLQGEVHEYKDAQANLEQQLRESQGTVAQLKAKLDATLGKLHKQTANKTLPNLKRASRDLDGVSRFASSALLERLRHLGKSDQEHHRESLDQEKVNLSSDIDALFNFTSYGAKAKGMSKMANGTQSTTSLRKSQYPGILESWNTKYNKAE